MSESTPHVTVFHCIADSRVQSQESVVARPSEDTALRDNGGCFSCKMLAVDGVTHLLPQLQATVGVNTELGETRRKVSHPDVLSWRIVSGSSKVRSISIA